MCQREHQGGRSPSGLFPPLQLCCNKAQVTCVYCRACLIFSLQTQANPLCIGIVMLLFTSPPLLEGPTFPSAAPKCEINEGFHLSCVIDMQWPKDCTCLTVEMSSNISGRNLFGRSFGCKRRIFPRMWSPLGANYNWTIPWKRKFASPLVNWALIIFTL